MRLAVLAIAAVSLPAAVDACMVEGTEAVIHSALPNHLPKDTFVARVVIGPGAPMQMFRGPGIRARVVRVVQGDRREKYVLLQRSHISSCDNVFLNGHSGYLVGVPHGRQGGLLVVDPITVDRSQGFKLPEDFEVSESLRAGHIVVDSDAMKGAYTASDPPPR